MRRKITRIVVAFFILNVCVMGTFLWTNKPAYANATESLKRTIIVTGSATVKVTPNIAYIQLGVNTFDADANTAQEKNKTKMNQVMEQLKQLGIEEQYIKTVDYQIYPRYEWKTIEKKDGTETQRERILTGYDVTNSIQVTVYDLDKIGSIIDLSVQEGINEANHIAFGLTDETRTLKYLEALKGAVEDGKTKAEHIAAVYGIHLTEPVSIVETSAYIPSTFNENMMGKSVDMAMADSQGSTTPISSGEVEIQARVNITYQY